MPRALTERRPAGGPAAPWRPLLTFGGLALLVFGLLLSQRTALWNALDLQTRHRLIALVSQATARRPETADQVPVSRRNPKISSMWHTW